MDEKIKLCPFCGQKLELDDAGCWNHIENGCILCWIDSEYGTVYFSNHPVFIKAWNRRDGK